jgi:predicted RNA-binding protein with RPS1 domain
LFNGYFLYDLPFGKGRKFGSSVSNVLNTVIGGWSLASNFTLHTGFALYPHGPDSSLTGSASPRPNCVAGVSQKGSGNFTDPNAVGVLGLQFLNPASVTAAAPGTFGTCAAGAFRGPGLATSDMSITKNFSISERTNLQFITQFINLTNTPILGAPDTSIGPTFGVISPKRAVTQAPVIGSGEAASNRRLPPLEPSNPGDEVEAVVLAIDVDKERISLGIKQLSGDPFNNFISTNDKGSIVQVTIKAVDPKGAVVQLADDVEGSLRASELSSDRVEDARNVLKEGETMTAMIVNIDRKSRNINVSIKAKDSADQQEAMQKFSADTGAAGTTNLGALLKAKLNETNQ